MNTKKVKTKEERISNERCEFCKDIGDINEVQKNAQNYDCFLLKDSASNVGFGMCIGGTTYATVIDFCPYCGSKLMEDET